MAGSDATAVNLDEVGYGHPDGHCRTAMRTGKVVAISSPKPDLPFRA